MEKRALRRHQQWVAKLHHVRIVWRWSDWSWSGSFGVAGEPDLVRPWRTTQRPQPWQQVSRCTMNGEPTHWQYAFNIRPSRIRQNRLLRDIVRGVDPDAIVGWPDYRRPHIYYW